MDPVHCQLGEHRSHCRRDVWKQQQLRSAFELFVGGEQWRQSSVQDAIRRVNPLASGDVAWLVASESPRLRFERGKLVGSTDHDKASVGGQPASVTLQHGDKPVDDVDVDRQSVLLPAAAEVQHDIRTRRRRKIFAEQKLLHMHRTCERIN